MPIRKVCIRPKVGSTLSSQGTKECIVEISADSQDDALRDFACILCFIQREPKKEYAMTFTLMANVDLVTREFGPSFMRWAWPPTSGKNSCEYSRS